MSTNDATRFIRWGLPGWVGILVFVVFVGLDSLLVAPATSGMSSGTTPTTIREHMLAFLLQIQNPTEAALLSALLVAFAGLPLGFVIYQCYFFFRWNSPFSRDGLFPPFIVGRADDINMMVRDIHKKELALADGWRNTLVFHPAYEEDHGFRWRYIDALISEGAQRLDADASGFRLHDRRRYLTEILHTLGASIVAIYFGFLAYIVFKAFAEPGTVFWQTMIVAFIFGVNIVLLDLDDRNRKTNQDHHRFSASLDGADQISTHAPVPQSPVRKSSWMRRFPQVQYSYLAFIFSALLGYATLMLVPSFLIPLPGLAAYTRRILFQPSPDIVLKFAFALLVLAAWLYAIKRPSERYGTGVIALGGLLAVTLLRVWLNRTYPGLDRSIVPPAFLLVMLNTVMIANRQNTRNELVFIEYITLRRYLTLANTGSVVSSARPVRTLREE